MTEAAPTEPAHSGPRRSDVGIRIVHGTLAALAIVTVIAITWCAVQKIDRAVLVDLVTRHGPAVIGIPLAVALAISVVCGLRAIDGSLRVKLLGLEAEGAGAALLGWIAVFSAIILAIRALW